jgi:cytochrome c5
MRRVDDTTAEARVSSSPGHGKRNLSRPACEACTASLSPLPNLACNQSWPPAWKHARNSLVTKACTRVPARPPPSCTSTTARTVVHAASSFKLHDIVALTLQPSSRRFVDHRAPLSPTPSLKSLQLPSLLARIQWLTMQTAHPVVSFVYCPRVNMVKQVKKHGKKQSCPVEGRYTPPTTTITLPQATVLKQCSLPIDPVYILYSTCLLSSSSPVQQAPEP